MCSLIKINSFEREVLTEKHDSNKKGGVIFTRENWEELRKNTNYSELIEDIEDRMEWKMPLKSNIKVEVDL